MQYEGILSLTLGEYYLLSVRNKLRPQSWDD